MKKDRRRSRLVPVLLTALVVGPLAFLLGRRSAPAPAPADAVVTLLECPAPVACGTPTPASSPATTARRTPPASTRPQTGTLPPLRETADRREELLQFIRDRSPALQDCAKDQRDRLRFTLRIDLADKGAVKQVKVLEEDALHQQVGQCVAQRVGTWRLPEDWIAADRSLVVAVVL